MENVYVDPCVSLQKYLPYISYILNRVFILPTTFFDTQLQGREKLDG